MTLESFLGKIKRIFVDVVTKVYDDVEYESRGDFFVEKFENLLLESCKKNDIIAVNQILTNGVNVNVADGYGLTPIIIACKFNNTNMARLLLKNGAKVNVKSKRGEIPIIISCERNNRVLVRDILGMDKSNINVTDNYGRTPMVIALDNNNIDMVKCLLEYHPDLNIKDNRGRTPITIACQKNDTYLTGLFLDRESISQQVSTVEMAKFLN